MKKIDKTVLKETIYILSFTIVLSLLMQSVFLIARHWDYTVLLGNILGIIASVGNFFLMGLTVQSAVLKQPDDAKKQMKASQSLRLLLLFVIALIGYLLPIFNTLALIIPYLFPRIAIAFRPFVIKD